MRGWLGARLGLLRPRSWLAAVVGAFLVAPGAGAADRVYWANNTNSTISFANLDGSGGGGQLSTFGAAVNVPFGIALDSGAGRIYWRNNNDTIWFANLDGSGGGGQLSTAGATPAGAAGVALDPVAGRIYWANYFNNTISFARLDGSGGGGELSTAGATPDKPFGVTLDPGAGRIYWANDNNTISFARLDGSGGGGQLNLAGATPNGVRGVALDPGAGRIYWTNAGNNTISFARLDGSGGGGQLSTAGAAPNAPYGVALDPGAGRIYWTNVGNNTISFARLDGTGGGGQLNLAGATPSGPNFLGLLRAPTAAGAPVVTGGSVAGSQLSCSAGVWTADLVGAFLNRAPQRFAYQWSVGGADIPGANANVHTPSGAGDYSCRVSVSNGAGASAQTSAPHTVGPSPPPPPGVVRARISLLRASRTVFAAGRSSTPLSARTTGRRRRPRPRGTVFSFRLDRPATVRIAIRTRVLGRRVGRRCLANTRARRGRPRCLRTITKATLTRTARAGLNRVAFSGRIRGRALAPRRYTAVFTARNAAGTSPARSLSFRIVRP